MSNTVELKSLVGEHILDAVDFSTSKRKKDYSYPEDSGVMRFRLDGVVYAAIEDPNDGFRSMMDDLVIDNEAIMKNVFQSVKVVGRYRIQGAYGETDDVLELIDVTNGKVVLEVGTSNTDDYYPYFVASFLPENMAINSAVDKP